MPRFRKKPVEVSAVQWDGNSLEEIADFTLDYYWSADHQALFIQTLEGDLKASVGDWIIEGVQGGVYPCKPDVFAKTYEKVEA